MSSNTTKTIRAALAKAIKRVEEGTLSAADGKNLIGLANQISQSMAVECKVMEMKIRAGQQVDQFGSLEVD